jgi:hypothetical protein
MSDNKIHDEKGIVVPPEIIAVGFDFPRDIEKIWRLDLPVEEIPIADLAWQLELPWFWTEDKPFSIKPQSVINNPEEYTYRIERIMDVDLSCPIDIMYWKDNWLILDGLHRLCKAILMEQTKISVHKVPQELIPRIIPD